MLFDDLEVARDHRVFLFGRRPPFLGALSSFGILPQHLDKAFFNVVREIFRLESRADELNRRRRVLGLLVPAVRSPA